ncbi:MULTISPECIES: prepilin peptidase [unclassified Moraxella]|uniref:prepilin peptidase n=1 Tax=unclassified Moraxella TaxID=2685852 RepID=UPI003AF5012E
MGAFSEIIDLLQQLPMLAMIAVAILGLCVGSFLNVVIYRTPLMMEQQWKTECQYLLHPDEPVETPVPITLSFPPSRCPHCGHQIRWYENIPVVSWLALRGKCSDCKNPISFRYPMVEIITAILSVLVVVQFGVTAQAMAGLLLTWMLVALTGIDFDTQLLPDRFTLPLAGLGLFVNVYGVFVSPTQAIFGYVIGFLCLWIVYKVFLLLTGKHGMGHGDFKLLAALGAWLGPMMLPLIVFLSAVIGSIIGVILMKRAGESKPFAFGPYIAMAGMVALLFGNDIMHWYLGTMQP